MVGPRSDPEFFDAKFRADPDPWRFDTRWYERRKRALLMALLPHERYRLALEPGCANGHLTAALAQRCDRVIATDIAPRAVELTTRRCATMPAVEVHRWGLGQPWRWPGDLDLLFLSEVAYYLTADELTRTATDLASRLAVGGTIVLAHWRHPEPDHQLTGDHAHDLVLAALAHRPRAHYDDADLRVDVLETV
ncbi:class I SAM-dependent methyltransferase [Nocardia aurantia]|uniref:SAM-dependent methyltransferase n=1 Tax=Nocardia aurantia TaxID=2585199 RepID=A0A7K0DK02_9NOCA|nr:SAM-dependent methyltransferase [Nocardia aurantia]MQY25124.1 hypothetical protein [Nocardia aurantia]